MAFKIGNGPSKFDLMLALFDREPHHYRSVAFNVVGWGFINAYITGVTCGEGGEDLSGQTWDFQGWLARENRLSPNQCRNIKGQFDTVTRVGCFDYVD